MLDVVIGVVVVLLLVAGVLVMLGPTTGTLIKRARELRRASVPSVFQAAQPREPAPSGLNPKTQRVLVAAARLANWLRAHGHDDVGRELRTAAGKITSNEAAGLYAMQVVLRRLRSLNVEDRISQERLKSLTAELRVAVQDRFEQLELLPFKRP
jgi:transposase-like protein